MLSITNTQLLLWSNSPTCNKLGWQDYMSYTTIAIIIIYGTPCILIDVLTTMQMYLTPLMAVYLWWHWMKQARSESLGADQHWDLVKWSLVSLCSTGEGVLPFTPLVQCLALVQTHTSSPTLILVQCTKWELHQWALLDWVDTAVGVGSK